MDEFRRLRAGMRPGSRISQALDAIMTFIPHLCVHQPFDNAGSSTLLRQSGIANADMHSVFSAVLAQEFNSRDVSLQQA